MIRIFKFKKNDLNPSSGKQLEFSSSEIEQFFRFKNPEVTIQINYISFESASTLNNIRFYSTFKLSPKRGDYKCYGNTDGSINLKDFFIEKLHLTLDENLDDFFALKRLSEIRYLLYYIPRASKLGELLSMWCSQNVELPQSAQSLRNYTKYLDQPLQLIYYGAPGTGKSFTIDQVTNENNSVRTTFHPDSDYASFVGAYKPTMENVRMSKTFTSSKEGTYAEYVQKTDSHPGTEKKIVYKYVPQAFLKAYVEAWKRYSAGEDNPYYLVIEEINRGNCAQIFGDLFQLLDRNNMGCSSYAISADEDIAQFLRDDEKGFGKLTEEQINAIEGFKLKKDSWVEEEIGPDILNGSKLLLPPNLRIWATMNTSDQSLFPIDSAFKRRWNWEYMPIEYDPVDKHTKEPIRWKLEVYDKTYYWGQFLEFINPKILKLTLSEDKQMGYFFAKPDKKGDDGKLDTISHKVFVNKVLFYLWTDVFKDYDLTEEPFVYENDDKSKTPFRFTDFFSSKGEEMLAKFMDGLKLPLVSEETEDVVDEMEDGTIGSLGKFKVNGGKADTITWSVHQLLKPVVGNMSYEQLASKIKEFIPRQDKEVIKVIENPQAYTKENGWLKHYLTTADGISFVITNQWKKEYIPMVKALADNLGVEFEQI
ncbi:MAG: AAA family ATPase [Muribaculaceae bacterium]